MSTLTFDWRKYEDTELYSNVSQQLRDHFYSLYNLREIPKYGLQVCTPLLLNPLTETHLIFKGQGLPNISREPIYDDATSLWDLHDLLLDLSYCRFLENSEPNMILNYHPWAWKCQKSNKEDFYRLSTNNCHTSRSSLGFWSAKIPQLLARRLLNSDFKRQGRFFQWATGQCQNISASNYKAWSCNYSNSLHPAKAWRRRLVLLMLL